MRSDSEIIKSYLVSLGAQTDMSSFANMDRVMATSEAFVHKTLGRQSAQFVTYQLATTAALASVGGSVLGYIAHLANLDQQQQIAAMRFGMAVPQYRAVSAALDVMGKSMEDIFWGTDQMRRQFRELHHDKLQMDALLGPDYEKQMEQVREVTFQIQRLELKAQNFGMLFAHDILKNMGFGEDGLTGQLGRLNDYILDKMPQWSEELSEDFVPILHETWEILKGTGEVVVDLANQFTNVVGILADDSSIEGATTSFHQFAEAVLHVVRGLERLLNVALLVEKVTGHFGGSVIHGLASGVKALSGDTAGANREDALSRESLKKIAGDYAITDQRMNAIDGAPSPSTPASTLGSFLNASAAQKAMAAAQIVSKDTGIPANILFGQMGFETGGFTNRGARDLNNFAGIQVSGSSAYKQFNSVEDFAHYYERTLTNKRYTNRGILAARTPEAFARSLRGDGTHDLYFKGNTKLSNEKNIANYAAGIERFGNIQVSVTTGDVHSSSPEQVAEAARRGTHQALDERDRRMMAELNGPYGN